MAAVRRPTDPLGHRPINCERRIGRSWPNGKGPEGDLEASQGGNRITSWHLTMPNALWEKEGS